MIFAHSLAARVVQCLLVLLLGFSLVACGGSSDPTPPPDRGDQGHDENPDDGDDGDDDTDDDTDDDVEPPTASLSANDTLGAKQTSSGRKASMPNSLSAKP